MTELKNIHTYVNNLNPLGLRAYAAKEDLKENFRKENKNGHTPLKSLIRMFLMPSRHFNKDQQAKLLYCLVIAAAASDDQTREAAMDYADSLEGNKYVIKVQANTQKLGTHAQRTTKRKVTTLKKLSMVDLNEVNRVVRIVMSKGEFGYSI